jgi:type IV secretory pathway VirJ component
MIVLLAAAAYLVHTRRPTVLAAAPFGHLRMYPAWLRPKGLVFVLSGEHGWSTADEEAARDLARSDRLVFGIDTPELLAVQNRLDGCMYMPGVLEDYSRNWQHKANNAQYFAPALLGSDIGATLVYEAQIEAPPTSFSAAIALDPRSTLPMRRPFCDHPAAATNSAGQAIKPEPPGKNVPLRILIDSSASKAQRQFAASIPTQTPTTIAAGVPLHRSYVQTLNAMEAEAARGGVADLPLAEVSTTQSGCAKGFAVLYSGDGGWRDLDRSLADVLASKGMSVVGVDMLRYYWKEILPDKAAPDLVRILRYYQAHWHCSRIVLIGFSFGADMLPFLASRLPADLRAQVSLVVLLSPERTTAFEVQMNGWLGGKPKAGVPVAPEVRKLAGIKIQCIYGQDEADGSLCTDNAAGALTVLAKSGGHHFDQNYGELADQILAALPN